MPTSNPREDHLQLLRRILSSRQFSHADNLKKILRYLAEQAWENPGAAPKEYEIALTALGRPSTFDPRTDPIVRVSIGAIRDRLFAFFATDGRDSAWRIEVPKGQYRLCFIPNSRESHEEELQLRPTARFWQPYLESAEPNVIVYTEPLFFRDSAGRYFRDWAVNSIDDGKQRICESYSSLRQETIEPVYHYLSAGEMHCLLSLTRLFHEAGVPVETRNSRNAQWNELSNCNLILLGSPRTNAFLRQMQGDDPIVVHSDFVRVTDAAGDVGELCGRRFLDGSLHRMTEYAVLTRRPGVLPGRTVTMIATNHGRAIEGAAQAITLEDRVDELLRSLGAPPAAPPPSHFQVLFRVETVDIDDEVTAVVRERSIVIDPPERTGVYG